MSHDQVNAPGDPGEAGKPRRFFSLEARARIVASNKRRVCTANTRAKMRKAKLGKKRPLGPEPRRLAEEWQRQWDAANPSD